MKRRKLFDEDADWVPQKRRLFKMKTKTEQPTEETTSTDKPILDSTGLDRAYQQGDIYGKNNIGYVAGSHTARDWFDDIAKIPQWHYVPAGLSPIVDIMNTWWGREVVGTGDLRQSERYQKANAYLKDHPEIDTIEGHSLGGSVVLQLQKDLPDRHFKTITYGAPALDLFGKQKAEVGQENVLRFSNKGDIVSAFDNSALKTSHPDPQNYAPSFWHDFHNKAQADVRIAIAGTDITSTKADWTTEPWATLNPDKSISITE